MKNKYINGANICVLILGVFIILMGTGTIASGRLIWGVIEITCGVITVVEQFIRYTRRHRLQNIVLNEFNQNPNITNEEISTKTEISLKDVGVIIIDLKKSRRKRDI